MAPILGLEQKYLELIRNGQKIWEGRLNNDKYGAISVGDRVNFQSTSEQIIVYIEERREYPSFRAMLQDHGVNAFLPGQQTDLEQAIEVYRGFPGYRDGEVNLGAVAFRVRLIDSN